jgi:hypothetical protein
VGRLKIEIDKMEKRKLKFSLSNKETAMVDEIGNESMSF